MQFPHQRNLCNHLITKNPLHVKNLEKKEAEIREPRPTTAYRDPLLAQKEKVEIKRQLEPIISMEVDMSNLPSQYTDIETSSSQYP